MSTNTNLSSSKIRMNVKNAIGFHLRPMTKLVQLANQFHSDIFIECKDMRANGKSILNMLLLGIRPRSEFTVLAYGDDSYNAVQAINEFFKALTGNETAPM